MSPDLDTVDALIIDAIEEARRDGMDPDVMADRLDDYRCELKVEGFESYSPSNQ
jgi:hypothetical protein